MNTIELAVLTKNNRPMDIIDWVSYHLAIGFDKITIFDNNSTYSIKDLFNNDKVEVREIKEDYGFSKNFSPMYNLYSNFCKERTPYTKWLCFIDDDEYVYMNNEKDIKNLLNVDVNILCMYWKMISLPDIIQDRNTTLIDTFNYISPLHTPWGNNIFIKSIINLSKNNNTIWTDPHIPSINSSMSAFTFDKVHVSSAFTALTPDFYTNKSVVLYHYYHQSFKDREFKVNRAGTSNGQTFRPADFMSFTNEILNKYTMLDNSMINLKREILN